METDSSHTGQVKKKSTNLLWIVIAIVALIIIGISMAHFANKNTPTSSSNFSKKPFDAAVNSKDSMTITINTRAQSDKTGSIAILQSDGKGNYSYELIVNGEPFNTMIFTPEAQYACKDDSSPCIKYPRDTSANAFNPAGFTYTPSLINKIKAIATYHGQQNCPVGTGTCDVWLYGNKIDKKNLYVNTTSKNIVAVIDTGHFGTTEITTHIVYEYGPRQVTLPTNYKNAPAQPH
jgi:hypothetical protein